jgi:1-acyl-sn-glycerol-3-phosphate acyltransferase
MWIIRTFLYWFSLVVFTIFYSILAIVSSFINPLKGPHFIGRMWGKTMLIFSGVNVKITGNPVSASDFAPSIFMANHQSAFDIFTLLAAFPVPFRWVAKEELFKIPIFGPAMRRAGYVPINRGNPRDALKSLNKAAMKIKGGTSVVVFPEGTRSEDGKLLPFKNGGFILAIKSQVPIIPVAIHGTQAIKPKKSFWIHPRTVYLHFGDPIETAGMKTRDKELLKERTFNALSAQLKKFNEG